MRHLKTYELFEDSASNLFTRVNGGFDPKALVQVSKKLGKPGFPTKEKFDACMEMLPGADPDKVFHDPNGLFDKFLYWDGFLVFSMFHEIDPVVFEHMRIPMMFDQAQHGIKRMLEDGKYEILFSMAMNTRHMIPVFVKMHREIPEDKVYDVFVSVYTNAEYGFDALAEVLPYVYAHRGRSRERTKRLAKLAKKAKDGKLVAYRGVASMSRQESMSWTLSKKTAKFFAGRFGSNGSVIERTVDMEEVMDYLPDRNEQEILIYGK